ncbi:hypothetical protein [Peterkaempfera sp. SMS 1(5)a]|uniref:hypothetical protein n=1 Tax=Peterkaempfera podocarpi TaxID=3232308 RepID=UPI00366BD380
MKLRRRRKVFLAAVAQTLIIAMEAYMQINLAGRDGSSRLGALAPVPLVLYVLWRIFQCPYVTLDDEGVCVNNAYNKFFIPYSRIVATRGRSGLAIDTAGKLKVRSMAFDASAFQRKPGLALAERIGARIGSPHVNDEEVRSGSNLGIPEILGPGVSLILFLWAFISL